MGIQINGNTDNISATDGGLTVSDLELNQTGVSTFHSHLHVADQIIHLDDANSKIRFPAADTITAETAGTERLRITSDGEVKIMNTSGTVGLYFQSSSGAVSNFRAIGTNNQSLGYFFGNSEKVRFASNGKVGINSTAPTNMLDVVGGYQALGLYRNDFTGNSGAGIELYFGRAKADGSLFNCATVSAVGSDNTGQASQLRFSVLDSGSMSEKLRITSDGIIETGTAVGASGADGDQRLRVGRAGNCNIAVRATASTTAATGLDFGDSGDDRAGRIQYMHNGDYMSFHTNGAGTGASNERLRIDSSGRVIIGGISPLTDAQLTISADDAPAIAFQRSGSGKFESAIGMETNSALRFYNGADSGSVSGLTERMQIDASGRVMIGTTTEGHADSDDLTIATAGNTGITIRAGASNYGSIFFSDGTSGGAEYDGFLQYSHGNQRLSIGVASATKMTIFSNGHVGTRGNNTGNPVGMELKNENTAAYSHAELALTSQNATTSKIWCDVPNARLRMQYNGGSTVDIDQSGNIHVPSGSGISFAASGNFSLMNSEILDDYEEGYWTPTIGGHVSNGSSTYGNQKGSYVRVGGIVHLNWYISWTSTSATGQFRIYGMPYTTSTTYGTNYNITTGSMMFDSINTPYQYGQMVPYLAHGVNQIVFYSSYHTGGWNILSHDSYTANGGALICSITYRAA